MCSIKKLVKLTLIKTRMIDSNFRSSEVQRVVRDVKQVSAYFYTCCDSAIALWTTSTYTSSKHIQYLSPDAKAHIFFVDHQRIWRCCCHCSCHWCSNAQRPFCKLSANPGISTGVTLLSSAAPGRWQRGLPWSHIASSKSSTAREEGNPQSNVSYTQ